MAEWQSIARKSSALSRSLCGTSQPRWATGEGTMKWMLSSAAVAAAIALSGCDSQSSANTAQANGGNVSSTGSPNDPVADAQSAAPGSIGRQASVIVPQPDGSMKTLRQGSNGWTCIPDDPNSPADDPMCMDANGMKWMAAYMAHKPPPPNSVGLAYMLKGGDDASNTDPFATKPAAGADWVKTGPHVMILGADSLLKGYPSGPKPDTSAPYVMWAGTPYQHLMVPVTQ